MKKTLLMLAALCVTLCVYAEKPFVLAVTDDLSVPSFMDESDNRTASLLLEYFKSELATRSRLKLVDDQMLYDEIDKINQKRGVPLTAAQIQTCCKDLKVDHLLLTTLARKGEKAYFSVSIYNAQGKLIKTLQKEIDNIKKSDIVSVAMAREAALAIRGGTPVDVLSQQQEDRMQKEIDEDMKSEVRRYSASRIK